jgi:glycogen phosphorylase
MRTGEAAELYDLLEKEVIPAFYNRGENGLPMEWIARIRESMTRLTPQFSANRAVREYTDNYYVPAAAAYRERASNRGALGISLLKWKQNLAQHWAALRFGKLRVENSSHEHWVRVEVYLGPLRPDGVHVELYADPLNGESPFVSEMRPTDGGKPLEGWRIYTAHVPASRPTSGYTPRIIPSHFAAKIPLEEARILWFR